MKKIYALVVSSLILVASCSKHPIMPDKGAIIFNINHHIDGTPLEFDTIKCSNEAGNKYSVSRMSFYLSGFRLYSTNGKEVVDTNFFYIDARTEGTKSFVVDEIPPGDYQAIRFYFGLPPHQNKTNYLPMISENVNMGWPDPMGGGYHFMKFEGHYLDENEQVKGFAIHTGKNQALFEVTLNKEFSVKFKNESLTLNMNLNEWFTNPHVYDLISDGNYTMSSDSLIAIIVQNGESVFH
jgi:hypothetical protein